MSRKKAKKIGIERNDSQNHHNSNTRWHNFSTTRAASHHHRADIKRHTTQNGPSNVTQTTCWRENVFQTKIIIQYQITIFSGGYSNSGSDEFPLTPYIDSSCASRRLFGLTIKLVGRRGDQQHEQRHVKTGRLVGAAQPFF